LILNTLPEKTAEHYKNKIFTFIKWWKSRGYENEIPDYAPSILESKKLVPSWKRICKSLLRNDWWCKGLSFTQHKTEAYEKYLKLKKQQREEQKFKL
jgi:predicted phosphoadenosine phosphosulfate sulfurtransferase